MLYGLLAVGFRMVVQRHRTGSTGFNGLRAVSGSMEWVCVSLVVIAIALCIVGGVLQLAGTLSPIDGLSGAAANLLGAVLISLGIAFTLGAQFAMGDSWRIGVDPSELTELVTAGPFAVVRNPIFAAMILAFAGLALLAPNVATISGAVLLMVALELQTRLIEEPFLLRAHREQYAAYAARTGRFLPGIGCLPLSGKPLLDARQTDGPRTSNRRY